MRSRAARLTLGTLALIAIGAAAAFIAYSEQQLEQRAAAVRTFDLHAREAADLLGDVRAGQQAYVAAGQGAEFWIPKVNAQLKSAAETAGGLLLTASNPDARSALGDVEASITGLTTADKRARDYLRSSQTLMASDVVFTEAGGAALMARQQIEAARLAELQAGDAFEAARRKEQLAAAAGAAAFALLVVTILAFAAPAVAPTAMSSVPAEAPVPASPPADGTPAAETPGSRNPAWPVGGDTDLDDALDRMLGSRDEAAPASGGRDSAALDQAAELCTALARVDSAEALQALLTRASTLIDASGLIVWLGSADGADLRPVLAHGYAPQTLAKLGPVPQAADNAAATAYRTGLIQTASGVGSQPGALVAPLLGPGGCIGAIAAEIKGGRESSRTVQALASIIAAQLAGLLSGSEPAAADARRQRAAART